MSAFEAVMLICFGAAWPVSIFKSLTTRSVEGKSLGFLIIVLIGYAAGVLHKVFYDLDRVIMLYIINLLLVGIDILVYLRNVQLNKREDQVIEVKSD